MMLFLGRLFLIVAIANLSGLAVARTDADTLLAKARAYLGPDAALDAIKSIHYTGTLAVVETTPTGPKSVEVPIEIIFQKPFRQRIVATFPRMTEVTVLDNYDAWQRLADATDPTRWELKILGKDQVKRLRANTLENLSFYRGLERQGVRVELLGEANVNGTACQKVAFRHDTDISFLRYFDKATGRLVLTETVQGGSIREEGEIIVKGLRFPKKVITTTKLANGQEQAMPVTFTKITLNETFDDSLFVVPRPR